MADIPIVTSREEQLSNYNCQPARLAHFAIGQEVCAGGLGVVVGLHPLSRGVFAAEAELVGIALEREFSVAVRRERKRVVVGVDGTIVHIVEEMTRIAVDRAAALTRECERGRTVG